MSVSSLVSLIWTFHASKEVWAEKRLFETAKAQVTEAVDTAANPTTYLDWMNAIWSYEILVIDSNAITIGSLIIGLILILVGFQVSRRISRKLAQKVFPRVVTDKAALHTFETLSFYVLLVLLTIFALKIAKVPLTMFTVLGGAVAIGIGFGSQNIVNNFISGIILMIERPIKIGDFVAVNDIMGTVEEIGIRSTQVLLTDNTNYIVPNSAFLEKNVLNWTLSNDIVRTSVCVGVAYGSPIREVEKWLHEAVQVDERVLSNPKPVVLFNDFADNSLNFEILFWVRVRRLLDRRMIESDIRFRIDELFKKADIVIAFPQRDVHVDSNKPLEVRMIS